MKVRAALFLFLAAAIWGLTFVAQRIGAEYVGPFTFNAFRFALGSLSVLPVIFFNNYKCPGMSGDKGKQVRSWQIGVLAGTILFIAASLQQIGLIYTTAGKAAFITGLYIIIIPVAGLFLNHRIAPSTWCGSILALTGLYFLCVKQGLTILHGDLLVLISAFFLSAHLLLIDHFIRKTDVFKLAFFQFATCAALSLATALWRETISISALSQAGIVLLYSGVCAVGVAYTLQFIGQKYTSPAQASIILSMETVFAALGGYYILHEVLGFRELLGCFLMMAGMLLSQAQSFRPRQDEPLSPADN